MFSQNHLQPLSLSLLISLLSVQPALAEGSRHLSSLRLVREASALSHKRLTENLRYKGELYAQGQEQGGDWGDNHSGSQTATGSRGDCPQVSPALTALMPRTNWGKTTSENPTLWFYVPYTPEQIVVGEFVVQKADGLDAIEPIEFTLPAIPGFVSVTFPGSSLEVGTDYSWAFQLYCSRRTRTPITVEGWIQRVLPSNEINSQLNSGDSLNYQVYWENLIWFDGVDALMQERLRQPTNDDLETEWIRLLQEGGLNTEQLPTEPIVGSVLLKH